jgi:hypothetical protein
MGLADDYAASLDPRVIAQVSAAILAAAQNIYTEASPPANHPARAVLATKVMLGQISLQPLIFTACAFASLTAASTDITVNNAVATLWNTWAAA